LHDNIIKMIETTVKTDFANDIRDGLSGKTKTLPSKYFYDEKGDKIFQAIMDMPEYYLTECEFEIFSEQKDAILRSFSPGSETFNLIELGAGDGKKTKILLQYLLDQQIDFTYYPVDISNHILNVLVQNLKIEIPELKVKPINQEYFEALNTLRIMNDRKNIVLFLGSNIGNFHKFEATQFLSKLSASCRKKDLLLIGIDQKKDPRIIQHAYDDPHKITADFNLNLLTRINRELGADFDLTQFSHYSNYNPANGEVSSYIFSKINQVVKISALNCEINFRANEYIHTEISKKYSLREIEHLADNSGFKVLKNFIDSKNYFVDSLWEIT
jgi:L-histidine N-alpha-methyltransferase